MEVLGTTSHKIQYTLDTTKLHNKKVVLFGAGACGQDYFLQLQQAQIPLVWLASRPKAVFGYQVETIDKINTLEYDVVLIAISKLYEAIEMYQQLLRLNVPKEKIIWQPIPESSVKKDESESCIFQGTNGIMGAFPKLIRTTIDFRGKNNILFCEPGVSLQDSIITFHGNNSVVYLCKSGYLLNVSIGTNSSLYIGPGMKMNARLSIIHGEKTNYFIGNDSMVANEVLIRHDGHPIYDSVSKRRQNLSTSIFIGDHVWIGQRSILLKGTRIDSGSIVGAGSVVANKTMGNNCAYAGNPCKLVREQIFWEKDEPITWDEEQTARFMEYPEFRDIDGESYADRFIYSYDPAQEISFEDIDQALKAAKTSDEKLNYLKYISSCTAKNRFVHKR